MNKLKKYYKTILNWLSTGIRRNTAFLLSHGAIHLLVLIVLIFVVLVMYNKAMRENEIVFKDLNITWKVNKPIKNDYMGGTRKYEIEFFNLSIVPNYIENTHDISQKLITLIRPVCESDSIACTVELNSSKKNIKNHIFPQFKGEQIKENIVYYPYTKDCAKHNNTDLCNLFSAKNAKIYFRVNPRLVDEEDQDIQNVLFSERLMDGEQYSPNIEIIMGSHSIYSVKDISTKGELRDPYIFNLISPEPDILVQGKYFEYTDPKKINQIFNTGILVIAEEIAQTDRFQRRMILFNVLIGTTIAFCLEIIVQLIIKWRNLNLRKKN